MYARIFLLSLLFAPLLLSQGCACEAPHTSAPGQLATDQPGSRILFVVEDKPITKSLLLYNDGPGDISIRSLVIQGDQANVFSLLKPPALPLVLAPGKERGIKLKIQLKTTNSQPTNDVARLEVQLDGIDSSAANDFYVELLKTTPQGRLRFVCGAVSFGRVKYGQTRSESCILHNLGDETVTISGLLFQPEPSEKGQKETKRGEFQLAQEETAFPLVLKPNAKHTLFMTYKPQDFESLKDRGYFIVESDLTLQVGVPKPRLYVRGETLVKLIEVVPQMEVCESDYDCTWLDPKLRCRPFLLESQRRCQYESPTTGGLATSTTLKYAYVSTEKKATLGVVVRSVGSLPVTISNFVLLDGKASVWEPQRLGTTLLLQPYEQFVVELRLKGPVKASESGEFGIQTDADNTKQASVKVSVDAPACQLQLQAPFTSEGSLDTGAASVGLSTKTQFTLRNRGGLACLVSSVELGASKSFSFPQTPPTPITLEPGASHEGILLFSPEGGAERFTTKLQIKSDMPGREVLDVPVLGTTLISCVEVTPAILDFGTVSATCDSKELTVQVRNVGRPGCGAFNLQNVSLKKGSSAAMTILSAPGSDVAIAPGKTASIKVRFKPTSSVDARGVLVVETSLEERGNVAVPMQAFGGVVKEQTDIFRQLKRPKADILFVIDNGFSMGDKQANLAKNFIAYMQWQVRLNIDYNIMVTTTDVSGEHYPPGCAVGATKVLSRTTPDLVSTFLNNVRVGTGGSAKGQGLEAAYQALQPGMQNDPKCNKGFYRQDAGLTVLFISDKDDQSPHSVEWYIQQFKALKGSRNMDPLRASVVVGPVPNGCSNPGVGMATPGARYWQVARQFKGVQESICNPNWASTLSNIGSITFGYRTQYFLSKEPDPTSIRVRVNGKLVKEDASNGWQFDPTSNSVNFTKSETPSPNFLIEVTYRLRCVP